MGGGQGGDQAALRVLPKFLRRTGEALAPGDAEGALAAHRAALAALEPVATSFPENAELQRDLGPFAAVLTGHPQPCRAGRNDRQLGHCKQSIDQDKSRNDKDIGPGKRRHRLPLADANPGAKGKQCVIFGNRSC